VKHKKVLWIGNFCVSSSQALLRTRNFILTRVFYCFATAFILYRRLNFTEISCVEVVE